MERVTGPDQGAKAACAGYFSGMLLLLVLACRAPAPIAADPAADSGEPAPPLLDWSGLDQSGVIACAAPQERAALGPFALADLGPDWALQRPSLLSEGLDPVPGAGAVVADLTGDGRLDIFLPARSPCMLFVGQADGTVRDESLARLPQPGADCDAWGASAADVDADGDLDLFIAKNGALDRLWFNDGAGHFALRETGAGFTPHRCGSRSASFGDMDGDGDLDLFVARHHIVGGVEGDCPQGEVLPGRSIRPGDPNSLYENRGDGVFADVSARLGDTGIHGYSFLGSWLDVDDDGDLDLYIINDYGSLAEPNLLYLNDGWGGLSLAGPESGLALAIDGMGLGFGDLNEDGLPDLFVSDIDRLHLMLSLGERTWYDAATSLGLDPVASIRQRSAWGVELADMDNDGLLDAVAPYGPTEGFIGEEGTGMRQPDALFQQQPDGSFLDVAAAWGLNQTGNGRGLVLVDFNQDGWLDLLRPDYRGGPASLHLSRCGTAAWLTMKLVGEAPFAHARGARVTVVAGDRSQLRWLQPGSTALASSGPLELHFGLGDLDQVDSITVDWPDGRRSVFGAVATRQRLTITQSQSPQD